MNDPAPRGGAARGTRARDAYGRLPGLLLVGGGLLLAAATLRPDGGLLGTPTVGPLGGVGFVVLFVLGWLLLVGRFTVRYREEVRHLAGPTPWAEQLRSAAVLLLGGTAVVVPVLLVVLHKRASPESDGVTEVPELRPTPIEPSPPPLPKLPDPPDGTGLLGYVVAGVVGALAVALVAAFVWALLHAWRPRRLGRRPATVLPAAPPRPEDVLAEAVATGLRALAGGDARAAVIACYAAMENSLAVSGMARRAWDSPTELLERAVAEDLVEPVHAGELTALFREARYSSHPMDDGHVRRARAALDAIAAHLARRVATADDPATSQGPAGPQAPTGAGR
ncbi:DUF4129 domain-containing protein [Kitasatospora sp. NPDC004240]